MAKVSNYKSSDSISWGYLTAFILLFISYILTFYGTQQVLKQQEIVIHTATVINSLDDLITETLEAESDVRAFLLTKDEKFLNNYYRTPGFIDATLKKMKQLSIDNPMQEKRLETLQASINNKMNFISTRLSFFKNNNYRLNDSLINASYLGKQLMDTIKLITHKLIAEENSNMSIRSKKVTYISNFIKVINVASIVIAIVLAFYSITSFNRENKARHQADERSRILREQLEMQVNELNKLNVELVELRSIEKFAVTGRISRTIAHEVRNPLTNINLATEHLKSEVPQVDETQMLFDMITRNSNRINDLISDLLNSTKAGQLDFVRVNVNDMVESSLEFAQDRLSLKEIKVIKYYDENLLPILVDTEKINIVFLNIIVNAIEAMESKKGILTLKTEDKNNRCVVIISDNGKGMDKESLSKIFEPYFTTKEKGNGLGLTNTQNIVIGHNANIYAESIEGEGTSFIISFNYA
jgi:signal transduction histidine kinase